MKRILIIEHGGYLREFIFKKIVEKKCIPYVVTTKPENWLLKYTERDRILVCNTFNSQDLITEISSWIVRNSLKFDAVGSFIEASVIYTADVASALNLIGIGSGVARRSSQNKLLMRNFLKQRGYKNQPDFKVININDKKFPVVETDSVIKPLFGSSSHGVVKIPKGNRLNDKIKIALNTMSPKEREGFKNFKGHFLLEKYVPGKVYSVDGVIQNNLTTIAGITEFIMGPEPYFTQIGSITPAETSEKLQKKLYSEIQQIITILGFNNCGFHAEFRIKNDKPYLLEIAGRLPGGGIQPGYQKALNIDLTGMMIDIWLGNKIKSKTRKNKYVLHYSMSPTLNETAILKKISGLDKIKKLAYVWNFYQFSKVGDKLFTYPNTPTQIYYVAIEAETREELLLRFEEVKSLVKIETEQI